MQRSNTGARKASDVAGTDACLYHSQPGIANVPHALSSTAIPLSQLLVTAKRWTQSPWTKCRQRIGWSQRLHSVGASLPRNSQNLSHHQHPIVQGPRPLYRPPRNFIRQAWVVVGVGLPGENRCLPRSRRNERLKA